MLFILKFWNYSPALVDFSPFFLFDSFSIFLLQMSVQTKGLGMLFSKFPISQH